MISKKIFLIILAIIIVSGCRPRREGCPGVAKVNIQTTKVNS